MLFPNYLIFKLIPDSSFRFTKVRCLRAFRSLELPCPSHPNNEVKCILDAVRWLQFCISRSDTPFYSHAKIPPTGRQGRTVPSQFSKESEDKICYVARTGDICILLHRNCALITVSGKLFSCVGILMNEPLEEGVAFQLLLGQDGAQKVSV